MSDLTTKRCPECFEYGGVHKHGCQQIGRTSETPPMSERYAVVVFNRLGPTAVRGPFGYESEAIAVSQVVRLDPDHKIAVLPLRAPDVNDLHFGGTLGDMADR